MARKTSKPRVSNNSKKAQSAIEYMLSYSWAIIVVAVVFVLLYLFVFVPGTIAPNTCTFSNGANCQAIVFGSNSQSSSFAVLLSNNQQFAIINPVLYINTTQYGVLTATCAPNLVLPGGAMICSNTISTTSSQGSLVYGKTILQAIPCPSKIYNQCTSGNVQNYAGTFSTHSQPILSSTPISITLAATNTTQLIGGGLDPLTATVKMLGYPITGATVVFSAVTNPQYATFSPNVTTSTSNGTAISEFSGLGNAATGTSVEVKATYAGVDSNIVTITLQAPVGVTFALNPAQMSGVGATTTVLTIDSTPYVYSQFTNGEITVNLAPNSQHTYSFSSAIGAGTGIQYGSPSFDNNCGVSSAAGQLSIGTAGCASTITYKLQYYLTVAHSGDGVSYTLSPLSGWQNAGNLITINEQLSDSVNNAALGWSGTSGSYDCAQGVYCYSGSQTSNTFTLNAPTTEYANVNAIYTLTLKLSSATDPTTMESGVSSNTIISLVGSGVSPSLTYSNFPYTVRVISGNSIGYTYKNGVQASTNDGIRYLFTSTKSDNQCATGNSATGSITISGTCTELTGNYQPQDQITFAVYNSLDYNTQHTYDWFSGGTANSGLTPYSINVNSVNYQCSSTGTGCTDTTIWQNYNTALAYSYNSVVTALNGQERWNFASAATSNSVTCILGSSTNPTSTVTATNPCTVTASETKQGAVIFAVYNSMDVNIDNTNFHVVTLGASNYGCSSTGTSCTATTAWQNLNAQLGYTYFSGELGHIGGTRWVFDHATGNSGCALSSGTTATAGVTPSNPCIVTAYENKQFLITFSIQTVNNAAYASSLAAENVVTLAGTGFAGGQASVWVYPGTYSYSLAPDQFSSSKSSVADSGAGWTTGYLGSGSSQTIPAKMYYYQGSDGGCGISTLSTVISGSVTISTAACSAVLTYTPAWAFTIYSDIYGSASCVTTDTSPSAQYYYYKGWGQATSISTPTSCGSYYFNGWTGTGYAAAYGGGSTELCPAQSGYNFETTSGSTCIYCPQTYSGYTVYWDGSNCYYNAPYYGGSYIKTIISKYTASGSITTTGQSSTTYSYGDIVQHATYTTSPPASLAYPAYVNCNLNDYVNQFCTPSGYSAPGTYGCWGGWSDPYVSGVGSISQATNGCTAPTFYGSSSSSGYSATSCFSWCGYQLARLRDEAGYGGQTVSASWTCYLTTGPGTTTPCGSSPGVCASGYSRYTQGYYSDTLSYSYGTCTYDTMVTRDCPATLLSCP